MTIAFRAHKGGTSQTACLTSNYTPVCFSVCDYNDGGYFNLKTGLWTPPAGLVLLSCNVWCSANFAMPPTDPNTIVSCNVCAKFRKTPDNGVSWYDLTACPGWTPAGFTRTAGAVMCGMDYASGTEAYQLIMFTTSIDGGNDVTIDGNHAHTWWCGAVL